LLTRDDEGELRLADDIDVGEETKGGELTEFSS
jgi:hypothetical protein